MLPEHSSKAQRPSEITLPAVNQGWPTVLAFLIAHFHRIDAAVWQQRVAAGKVHWFNGDAISAQTPFLPSRRVCYYREVPQEPKIDAPHQLLFQNEHILLACKPHGLPVTPGGDFVNECLLERVRRDTGLTDIAPVHRLDKDTAGLVLFSVNAASRPLYYQLFADGNITKQYQAVAMLPPTGPFASAPAGTMLDVRNCLEKSTPAFVMQVTDGLANSYSSLMLLARQSLSQWPANERTRWFPEQSATATLGLFQLTPHTGKTHQLRVHMAGVGCALLGDRYYPTLQPKQALQPNQLPLQLLAKQLQFIDPVDQQPRHFISPRQLQAWQPQ